MFNTGDVLRFINPLPDEIGLTMRVLEVNGDRLLVEYLVGMCINPQAVVLASDVTFWNK